MPKTVRTSLHGFLPPRALLMARKGAGKSAGKNESPVQKTPRAPISGAPDSLTAVAADLEGCQRCKLGKTRKHVVLGEGDPHAQILFVGEGPGEQEDLQGRPFVGRAGQLLDKMIEAMGLRREQVFIANIVKCRPPQNRFPEPDEVETCSPFLMRQIAAIQPKVIVALGKCAMQSLLKNEVAISKMRGKFIPFQGAKMMPTFHPSYLLRNPAAKKEVWEDLKAVAKEVGIQIPKRGASPGAQI